MGFFGKQVPKKNLSKLKSNQPWSNEISSRFWCAYNILVSSPRRPTSLIKLVFQKWRRYFGAIGPLAIASPYDFHGGMSRRHAWSENFFSSLLLQKKPWGKFLWLFPKNESAFYKNALKYRIFGFSRFYGTTNEWVQIRWSILMYFHLANILRLVPTLESDYFAT